MSAREETADEIVKRFEREAEELRAKAQDELKELAKAERVKGLEDRELRREQLYGAHALKRFSISDSHRAQMEMMAGEESWLWAREELVADGWKEDLEDGKKWWKRGPK